jgi:Hypervirulence associated proteins TUDOR domain
MTMEIRAAGEAWVPHSPAPACNNAIVLKHVLPKRGVPEMARRFKIGDHVSWNSEAGRVSGTIIAIRTSDFDYKGHVHHASEDDPQYEIKSDKTDHIAAHKGSALEYA